MREPTIEISFKLVLNLSTKLPICFNIAHRLKKYKSLDIESNLIVFHKCFMEKGRETC